MKNCLYISNMFAYKVNCLNVKICLHMKNCLYIGKWTVCTWVEPFAQNKVGRHCTGIPGDCWILFSRWAKFTISRSLVHASSATVCWDCYVQIVSHVQKSYLCAMCIQFTNLQTVLHIHCRLSNDKCLDLRPYSSMH